MTSMQNTQMVQRVIESFKQGDMTTVLAGMTDDVRWTIPKIDGIPFSGQRRGRYRPRVVARAPRAIPDDQFDRLFARLGSHRDRALVAFWVSTGARAAELLGATAGDVDPGQQVITVLYEAGVVVRVQLHRDPEGVEKTPQAVLLAQRRG